MLRLNRLWVIKYQGLKNMHEAIVPTIYNEEYWDEKIVIEDDLAYQTSRRLALEEGSL